MTTVRVHLDLEGGPVTVGTARINHLRGTTTTQFTYDDGYLAGPGWAISPDLPVMSGQAVTEGLPGALDDSAPDTWGRNLITRRLAAQARDQRFEAGTATEAEYLLGVHDLTRQGALRFSLDDGEPFLAVGRAVPQILQLETLLDATRQVAQSTSDEDDAVSALLDAGSGSLGGARPKASVTDRDRLLVAKFPHPEDQWDVMRWEAVALDLAERCRLSTPRHEVLAIGQDTVLLVERFDRRGQRRIPYLSARSLINTRDDTGSDYVELVEAIFDHGSAVDTDLEELWRRIAFSVVINNTDDHMRNHGFLRSRGGWALSPVFDVNPNPSLTASRVTAISGATSPTMCRDALFETADRFNLTAEQADAHWRAILDAVKDWRNVAAERDVVDEEIEQFRPVLDRWVS